MIGEAPPQIRRKRAAYHVPRWIICLVICLLFGGCGTSRLYEYSRYAKRGDHQWIARQTIDCRRDDDDCGRLHLMQGDACFHLAVAGHRPDRNHRCAAEAYGRGLSMMPALPDDGLHRNYLENQCESLVYMLENPPDPRSPMDPSRLSAAAKALYRLAPESPSAVYYLSKARFVSTLPHARAPSVADRPAACVRLIRTLDRVLSMMEAATRKPPPDWDRFSQKYDRLAFDLGNALQFAGCR